jgi:deoxyhypusine monooxygenase
VRHEAGEALGAIGTEECLQPIRAHVDDAVQEVRGQAIGAQRRRQAWQPAAASWPAAAGRRG